MKKVVKFWCGNNPKKGNKLMRLRAENPDIPVNKSEPTRFFVSMSIEAFIEFILPHIFELDDLKEILSIVRPKNTFVTVKYECDHETRKYFMSIMGWKDQERTGVSTVNFDRISKEGRVKYIPKESYIKNGNKLSENNPYNDIWPDSYGPDMASDDEEVSGGE